MDFLILRLVAAVIFGPKRYPDTFSGPAVIFFSRQYIVCTQAGPCVQKCSWLLDQIWKGSFKIEMCFDYSDESETTVIVVNMSLLDRYLA